MKLFLSFFLGLGLGIAGSVITYKWRLRRRKKEFYAFPRLRFPARSTDRIRRPKKWKGRFRPVLTYSLVGTITLLVLSILAHNALNPNGLKQTKISLPQKTLSSSPLSSSIATLIKKEIVVPKPAPLKSNPQQAFPAISPKKILFYPYSVKLGSFRTLGRAIKAINLYTKRGLSPYWVKVGLNEKEVWYRVFTGHFTENKQAERFRRKHRLMRSIVKKTQYANLIGVYTSSHELEEKILSIKNLGYYPYVIKDPEGRSRLFVGAFLTKAGAEGQQNDLKSDRVENLVVLR